MSLIVNIYIQDVFKHNCDIISFDNIYELNCELESCLNVRCRLRRQYVFTNDPVPISPWPNIFNLRLISVNSTL